MPDFTHETGEVAIRFHRESEWYVVERAEDVRVLRVHANGERAVELFLHFSSYLDSPVDVYVVDHRNASTWEGALRDLAEVRDALGRLRWPLASYGGLEVTLVTPGDQLSLMPSLELVICSRDGHDWPMRLAGERVQLRKTAPAEWSTDRIPWTDAPELTAALGLVVQRLALEPGS
jgi:hypothetical protein